MAFNITNPVVYAVCSDNELGLLCKNKQLLYVNASYNITAINDNVAGILGGRSGYNSVYDYILYQDGFTMPIHSSVIDTEDVENEDGTITTKNINNFNIICAQQVFNCQFSDKEVYLDLDTTAITTEKPTDGVPLYCFSTCYHGAALAVAKNGDIYMGGWHCPDVIKLGNIPGAVRCVITNTFMHVNTDPTYGYIITYDNKCYAIAMNYNFYSAKVGDLRLKNPGTLESMIVGTTTGIVDVVYNMEDNILGGIGLIALKTDNSIYNLDPETLQIKSLEATDVGLLIRQCRYWNPSGAGNSYTIGYITLDNKVVWNKYLGFTTETLEDGTTIKHNTTQMPENFKAQPNSVIQETISNPIAFLINYPNYSGSYKSSGTSVAYSYRVRFYSASTSNVVNYVANLNFSPL